MTTYELAVTDVLPPEVEVAGAKRRLYEVALALFGERGFHAVSIRDIATEMGQQPSALYFHVASKQDLLFDLVKIGYLTHQARLKRAFMDAGTDPCDQLRAITAMHVQVHLDYPALARLTNREVRSLTPDQYRDLVYIRAQTEQITIDVIERGVRLGVFTSTDAYLDAKAIGAIAMRLPEWWTPEAPRSKQQIIDRYAEYALKIVR